MALHTCESLMSQSVDSYTARLFLCCQGINLSLHGAFGEEKLARLRLEAKRSSLAADRADPSSSPIFRLDSPSCSILLSLLRSQTQGHLVQLLRSSTQGPWRSTQRTSREARLCSTTRISMLERTGPRGLFSTSCRPSIFLRRQPQQRFDDLSCSTTGEPCRRILCASKALDK